MEVSSLLNVNAPLAVSSVMSSALFSQTSTPAERKTQDDNYAVKLNLSQAAQNMLSSQQDVMGSKPVPETSKQEGNPSNDPDQQSRDSEDDSKEPKR